MKVKAATVEQHRFAVRRRGYDRAEVDAVMGRLSLSLRRYEEETGQLEARHSANGSGSGAHSFAHNTRGNPTEGEQTMTQAEDALTSARQQAEGILGSARAEITKMFDNLTGETQQVLAAADTEAAAIRSQADHDAKAVLAEANAESERLKAEASMALTEADAQRVAAREEAYALRQAAIVEATELRSRAEAEAADILDRARLEHDRLATRIPELRTALSQFEAQVHALAAEPVVDLNAIESEERSETTVAAASPSLEPAANAIQAEAESAAAFADEVGAATDAIPAPDGSGTLPAARDLVDLDEYRDLKTTRVETEQSEAEAEAEAEPAMTAVPATAVAEALPAPDTSAPLERLAGTHVAKRGIASDNETIYQRRGGGLRRRIKAQGDQD